MVEAELERNFTGLKCLVNEAKKCQVLRKQSTSNQLLDSRQGRRLSKRWLIPTQLLKEICMWKGGSPGRAALQRSRGRLRGHFMSTNKANKPKSLEIDTQWEEVELKSGLNPAAKLPAQFQKQDRVSRQLHATEVLSVLVTNLQQASRWTVIINAAVATFRRASFQSSRGSATGGIEARWAQSCRQASPLQLPSRYTLCNPHT